MNHEYSRQLAFFTYQESYNTAYSVNENAVFLRPQLTRKMNRKRCI